MKQWGALCNKSVRVNTTALHNVWIMFLLNYFGCWNLWASSGRIQKSSYSNNLNVIIEHQVSSITSAKTASNLKSLFFNFGWNARHNFVWMNWILYEFQTVLEEHSLYGNEFVRHSNSVSSFARYAHCRNGTHTCPSAFFRNFRIPYTRIHSK